MIAGSLLHYQLWKENICDIVHTWYSHAQQQGQPNRPMRSVNGEVMKGVGTPPVVVYKGGGPPESGPHGNHLYRGDSYDGRGGMMDSPARSRDFIQQGPQTRDSRTLTWDRNPKPDRSDPKYFPVNSLPRKNGGLAVAGPQQPAGLATNSFFSVFFL